MSVNMCLSHVANYICELFNYVNEQKILCTLLWRPSINSIINISTTYLTCIYTVTETLNLI